MDIVIFSMDCNGEADSNDAAISLWLLHKYKKLAGHVQSIWKKISFVEVGVAEEGYKCLQHTWCLNGP